MIDHIDLSTATIPYNYVLIKASANFDYHEIPTPDGKVTLQLAYFNQDKPKHLSITGKVIMLPQNKWHFYEKRFAVVNSGIEFEAMVRNSLEFDAECDISVGDDVVFDYREQVDVESERRIVRTDEYGLCILVRIDRIYGKYIDGDIKPVNGYVFFLRDQLPDKLELSSGILLVRNHGKYDMNTATVIAADERCKSHLEGEYEYRMDLKEGDRILLQKNRGFRIAYDIGNDDLKDIELCHRKDILGDYNNIIACIRQYEDNKTKEIVEFVDFKSVDEKAYQNSVQKAIELDEWGTIK